MEQTDKTEKFHIPQKCVILNESEQPIVLNLTIAGGQPVHIEYANDSGPDAEKTSVKVDNDEETELHITVKDGASELTCSSCGGGIRKRSRFCERCGRKLDHCPDCGHDIPDNQIVCGHCGYKKEVTCNYCGSRTHSRLQYCLVCGNRLTAKGIEQISTGKED